MSSEFGYYHYHFLFLKYECWRTWIIRYQFSPICVTTCVIVSAALVLFCGASQCPFLPGPPRLLSSEPTNAASGGVPYSSMVVGIGDIQGTFTYTTPHCHHRVCRLGKINCCHYHINKVMLEAENVKVVFEGSSRLKR
jgi:hypothetical protein